MQLIENATKEKRRGGFYTPAPIAHFILKWAVNGDTDFDILEPSAGDGVFLEQIKEYNVKYNSITAIELDEIEVEKTRKIEIHNKTILNTDFHKFFNSTNQRFDLVIGNPPYIRYQYFEKEQQDEAIRLFEKANLKYSKLTNAWVSFIVGASLLLKEKGKIGFVVPAEILQVSYAKPLREFLAKFFNKINIVSFKKLVFPEIQQEVVLLLCEKNETEKYNIEHLELTDTKSLLNLDINKLKSPKKKIDFKSNKWTYYFLEQEEIDFLENIANLKSLKKIGDYSKVEVGITTGSNDFFTVNRSVVEAFHLSEYAKPMVGRSVQVSGIRFNEQDWKLNCDKKAKAYFLAFPKLKELQNNKEAIKYLESGKSKNIHQGYKCRIRDEWQIVPSLWQSDALFIRRNNLHPKLILNEHKAYTTDTMHRIKIKKGVNHKAFAASFYNSLSFAFAEISGRSYGGGVLELMPSETSSILFPYNETNENLMQEIDKMFRENKSIDEILKFTNAKILKDNFGFTQKEIDLATSIWRKLSDRRINRKKISP